MKVFMSYSHADSALARRLADALRAVGLEVWRDEEQLFPGDNWALQIGRALEETDAMVVLMTPRGVTSRAVMNDVGYAIGDPRFEGKLVPVIPKGDENSVPTFPWLRAVQSVVVDENQIEDGAKRIATALHAA